MTIVDEEVATEATGREYAAYWKTDAGNWLAEGLVQVASWLRDRLGIDIDLNDAGEQSLGDRRVQVLHRTTPTEHGVRVRVWNHNSGATFVTTVLGVESKVGGWLWIQTTSTDARRPARKPRVADLVLGAVNFSDGGPIRAGVRHVHTAAVDELDALLDAHDRRLPVIVAAPVPDIPFGTWQAAVEKWTRQCAGIAHLVSLDPQSAVEFAGRHPGVSVRPGTLRTFPPGIGLDDDALPYSARWLSSATLATRDDHTIGRIIESFVRRTQVDHPVPLPSAVRDWNRAYDRIATQRLRNDLTPRRSPLAQRIAERRDADRRQQAPASSRPAVEKRNIPDAESFPDASHLTPTCERQSGLAEAERDRALLVARLDQAEATARDALSTLERVRLGLCLDDLSDESIEALLELATQEHPDSVAVDRLRVESESATEQYEALEAELEAEREELAELRREQARTEKECDRLTRSNTWLRSQIERLQPGLSYAFVDAPDQNPTNPLGPCPNSWEELITRLPQLSEHGIVFTGADRRMKDVAGLDLSGDGLAACWDALGTIASYVEARRTGTWNSNMADFCESGPPAAFHLPAGKHAHDESKATRQDTRMADERYLVVPTSVAPSGSVYMWTHFRPYRWSAQQQLRVHYYDQACEDGNVYVGYIGHHLTSGSTDKVRR